jgi:hypothetical protein
MSSLYSIEMVAWFLFFLISVGLLITAVIDLTPRRPKRRDLDGRPARSEKAPDAGRIVS